MPIKTDSLQRKLCDLLNVRGYKPEPKNSEGKTSPTPEDADVIKFTFSQDENDIDTVWVTIDSSHSLVIYYDDAVMREGNSKTPGLQYDDSWTGLLNQLKNWAQRRQLSFELKNKDHLASDMAQRTSMKKKEQVSEGYYPIGNKASYSDAVPNVKIILQHTRKIEEGEKRYRNISKIFVENTLGERFAVPTNKPGIARVYARHVAEGGSPYDSRGTHITSIVEEYTKMAGFVRATKNNQFNESTQQLIAEGINHYQSLRESLHKMTGHRGYNAYFESWTPTLNEEADDESSLGEMFVQETLDPRIESVMPILSKLHKKIAEMKEVTSLENWADDLIDEATDLKTIPENLGPEQKRVGQLGPTEKVGKKGTIGKLVGANESVGEEVDESWKQKLGAAALAGSMAMGANAGGVSLPGSGGSFTPDAQQTLNQRVQAMKDAEAKEQEESMARYGTEYLKRAMIAGVGSRQLVSPEEAKKELDRRAAAYERRSQGDQKINEGFLDEMHADLEELSEEDFEEEYNMTKAQAKEKYSSTGSWLNEQGVAEGSITPDVTVKKISDDGNEKEWHIFRGKEMIGYVIKNQPEFADGLYIAHGHGPGRAFDKEFTGLKPAVNYITSLKEGVAEGSSSLDEYERRLASIQSLRYDDPPEYAKKYSEILRLFPKEHHLYATGVQKADYSPGDRGSGTGRIGRVSEDDEMTQKKKEQVVTVKHKDSGKELRIVKTAVPDYQKRGYYPVKEQGVAESSDTDQLENWKAAVRKKYPNEAGQIKFKGKGFGDSIVAEIPGRDQAFGEFNMDTGEAFVAPLDESQAMVREAQDELEAMLRIIRK